MAVDADKSWQVVGIDGCRQGWAVAHWTFGGSKPHTFTTSVATDLAPLIERVRSREITVAAIDMPIGLFDGPRSADSAARKFLSPRGSTIFSAPARCTLHADSYEHACELSRAATGKALSIQAFNLLPKIRELDDLVLPEDQSNIFESHPECSFARLANGPLLESKHSSEGQDTRLGLLVDQFGESFERHWETKRPKGVSPIDILDAWSLVLTARRVVEGTAERFGGNQADSTGKVAQILY